MERTDQGPVRTTRPRKETDRPAAVLACTSYGTEESAPEILEANGLSGTSLTEKEGTLRLVRRAVGQIPVSGQA